MVPALDLMLEARMIKNQDEVDCLRICSTIGDAMFGTLANNLRPGIKESELCGMAHETAYRLGARVYSGIFVTSGPFAWPNPRDESDRMIRPGDILYMDVYNTSYLGYKICYYRTFSCGKASQKAKDDYELARDWLYRAIDIIKPGVTTRDLAEKWPPGPEIWKDIYIKHEDQTAGSNWGHGIGLTLYEYPIIWRETSLYDPITLQAGMTFAIETQHGTPGSHGVRIEEMVHVTENGCEIMSQWPVGEISEVPLYRVLKTRSPWIPSAPGGSHLHPVRSIKARDGGCTGTPLCCTRSDEGAGSLLGLLAGQWKRAILDLREASQIQMHTPAREKRVLADRSPSPYAEEMHPLNRHVVLAFLSCMGLGVVFMNFAPVLPKLQVIYGRGSAGLAFLATSIALGHALVQIPAGMIIDALGIKKTLGVSLAVILLSNLLCAYNTEYRLCFDDAFHRRNWYGFCFSGRNQYATLFTAPLYRGAVQGVFGASFTVGGVSAVPDHACTFRD